MKHISIQTKVLTSRTCYYDQRFSLLESVLFQLIEMLISFINFFEYEW